MTKSSIKIRQNEALGEPRVLLWRNGLASVRSADWEMPKLLFLSRDLEGQVTITLFQQWCLWYLWRNIRHILNHILQRGEKESQYSKKDIGICALEPRPWHLRSALMLVADKYILRWSPVLAISPRARWYSKHCRSSGTWQPFWIWRSVTLIQLFMFFLIPILEPGYAVVIWLILYKRMLFSPWESWILYLSFCFVVMEVFSLFLSFPRSYFMVAKQRLVRVARFFHFLDSLVHIPLVYFIRDISVLIVYSPLKKNHGITKSSPKTYPYGAVRLQTKRTELWPRRTRNFRNQPGRRRCHQSFASNHSDRKWILTSHSCSHTLCKLWTSFEFDTTTTRRTPR